MISLFSFLGILIVCDSIVDEYKLVLFQLNVEELDELLDVLADEVLAALHLPVLPLVACPQVTLELGEADHHVLEEVVSKHLLEQLQSVLQLQVKSGVLRVESDQEGVDVPDGLQSQNHVGYVGSVPVGGVTYSWSVDNHHWLEFVFILPLSEHPLGHSSLRGG
jgi:hypothetical protein